jgi:hypothetical protein
VLEKVVAVRTVGRARLAAGQPGPFSAQRDELAQPWCVLGKVNHASMEVGGLRRQLIFAVRVLGTFSTESAPSGQSGMSASCPLLGAKQTRYAKRRETGKE